MKLKGMVPKITLNIVAQLRALQPILENIPDSLGDIERVKTQEIILRNGIILGM